MAFGVSLLAISIGYGVPSDMSWEFHTVATLNGRGDGLKENYRLRRYVGYGRCTGANAKPKPNGEHHVYRIIAGSVD